VQKHLGGLSESAPSRSKEAGHIRAYHVLSRLMLYTVNGVRFGMPLIYVWYGLIELVPACQCSRTGSRHPRPPGPYPTGPRTRSIRCGPSVARPWFWLGTPHQSHALYLGRNHGAGDGNRTHIASLEDQANVSETVRDVGIICSLIRCRSGLIGMVATRGGYKGSPALGPGHPSDRCPLNP
jgi:hypothetical protein